MFKVNTSFQLYAVKVAFIVFGVAFSYHANAQTFDWVRHIKGNERVEGHGVGSDAEGNIYVTGVFKDTIDFNGGGSDILIRFSEDSILGSTWGWPGDSSVSITPGGSSVIFLAKYDSDGNYLWSRRVIGDKARSGISAVDKNGDIIIAAMIEDTSYFETNAGFDYFVNNGSNSTLALIKYDSDGNYIWAKSLTNLHDQSFSKSSSIEPYDLAIGSTGDIYVSGHFKGIIDFDPGPGIDSLTSTVARSGRLRRVSSVFLAKYGPNGNYIWAKMAGGEGTGRAIDIDTLNGRDNILLIGNFNDTVDFDPGQGIANQICTSTSGIGDIFIAKYDSSGSYIWAKGLNGTGSTICYGHSLSIYDSSVYITGGFMGGSVDFNPGANSTLLSPIGVLDMYIARYDMDGNYIWAKNIGGVGAILVGSDIKYGHADKSIYVTGLMTGSNPVDFNPSRDTATITPQGGMMNIFVAKYDVCGNYISAGCTDGNGVSAISYLQAGRKMTLNTTGSCYLTGSFKNETVDFDPGFNTANLTPSGSDEDAFLLKWSFGVDTTFTSVTITECSDSFSYHGVVYTASGIYKQIISGITRCDSIIVLDLTLSPIEQPVISIDEFILGVNNTYATYQWIKNGTSIPGATESTYEIVENAEYQVAVTNEEGCSDTSEIYKVDNYTSIKNIHNLANHINVYPNPTTDIIHIQSPVEVNITLTDIAGRVIMEVKNAGEISAKHLTAGIYLMQIKNEEGLMINTVKMVKQ